MKELGSGREEDIAVRDLQIANQQELNETLKAEIASLKENHAWLKKDNTFKTEQLNIFLTDCGTKNDQLYELRKQLLDKE